MKRKILFSLMMGFCLTVASTNFAWANNLSIANVTLQDRDPTNKTAIVQFDIHWENSWRDATNHDAVWVFLKVTKSSVVYHGMMNAAGINPPSSSPGTDTNLEVYVPSDLMGAFIRRKNNGTGSLTSSNVRLLLNYNSSPLSAVDTDTITVQVLGIEMVYIPTGPFYAGDTTATATLKQGSADTDPWYIASEAAISVTNAASNGYYYTTSGAAYEDVDGSSFTIAQAFPKGYNPFYCMKYEITEGQWVDFILTLSTAAKTNRDITASASSGKNSDGIVNRNTFCQLTTGTCTTDTYGYGTSTAAYSLRPNRAMSYLSWMDLCAYLDWAGLRPMTELEFEKAARGPNAAVAGEYAWGSTSITAAATLSTSPETGLETVATSSANAVYNATTFSLGDDYLGAASATGPLRAGIFANPTSTRATSGAGYYGVMDLSGNLYERVITIGNSAGRNFTGVHGDGILGSTSGYEGNANQTLWPHTDVSVSARGVTKGDGAGFKGGSWAQNTTGLTVSGRSSTIAGTRANSYGGRGVRSYDGP